MKALGLFLVSILLSSSSPAWDSVAVFHRPKKVIVLINEKGRTSRLQQLMDLIGTGTEAYVRNSSESVRFVCKRNAQAASCTFRFLPDEENIIEPKKVQTTRSLEEMGLTGLNGRFAIEFLNSNGDFFMLKIEDSKVWLSGSKR